MSCVICCMKGSVTYKQSKNILRLTFLCKNWKIKQNCSRIKICSGNSPIKSFESRFVPSFDAKILESSRCPFWADRWSGTCAWVFFSFTSISGLSRSCFTIYIQMNTNIITIRKWKFCDLLWLFLYYQLTPVWPFWAARCNAVFACKSLKFTSIFFAFKSISITFVQPFCAAKWIAAFLWLLPLLTSAPPRSKSSITPSLPFCAAIRSSVFPMCNYRKILHLVY